MIDVEVRQRFEGVLSRIRQPGRLVGEEFGRSRGFGSTPHELRVVLAFPDTYEIGISNQAVQILYHVARCVEGVTVERTYLPWVDAIAEMQQAQIPLLTVETWSPVVSADLLALTLQHEFDYTNVLELLQLAGIPLHASERLDHHPLVIGGGPACADFLPLARFLDAVGVGDGEALFLEVLEQLRNAKTGALRRQETKQRLSHIDGVYVPGLTRGVKRRVISSLQGAPYPSTCLVPLTAGVHDRAWVEVMRGCTRGCRFCQAGMWYRPVRERRVDEVVCLASAQLAASGHQELAFASLSTTDYSCLEDLLARTGRDHPEVRVSLPSLRVDSAAVRLAHLASPTGPSLTLAPEAGCRRMWDIINKTVTEEDVLAAAEEAFRTGRTTLKMYFMIGFPLEEDADVIAIAQLCLKVRELGRAMLGSRSGRLRLNISVNNFIPKPFTPFQWSGMTDRATLMRRQELLRSRLRRPGIKLTLHSVDKSYLEAALARGGEEMGEVIERAWRAGARFDSWTEQFRDQAWKEAFEFLETSAERLATETLDPNLPLPWDVISGVVTRDFLWAEWQKATRGETTPDCRWDECANCGVCSGAITNDMAAERGRPGALNAADVESRGVLPQAGIAGSTSEAARPAVRQWRYVATFSVTGRGRFIGHLDRLEILRRAIRRAGGQLALSAGMRPKPRLSLALPLAVGVEGRHELCEFELAKDPGVAFPSLLGDSLPGHMKLLGLESCTDRRSLPARVAAAHYLVQVAETITERNGGSLQDKLVEAASRFSGASVLLVREEREGRVRQVDVRMYVDSVAVLEGPDEACTLSFRIKVTPSGTARPERVVEVLGRLTDTQLDIRWIGREQIELA